MKFTDILLIGAAGIGIAYFFNIGGFKDWWFNMFVGHGDPLPL